jgi:predicted TIM-barrel fold metal-dependent hydrolase
MLGVDRAVLVQPSVYGIDNRALIDALKTAPDYLRGIAVLPLDSKMVQDSELEQLHAAGVRGLRCNLVDVADPSGDLPIQALTNLAQRIAPLGWHLELLMHVNEYPNLATIFAHFPVNLVFGHFGYCHAKHGVHNAGFQGLLSLMKEQRAWVKMTGPYRISAQSADAIKTGAITDLYADVRPFNDAVLAANPKQLVWGSDWPHVMVKNTMPHDADLCDLFGEWVSDSHLRQAILVSNPSMLYDFH